ncbi:hypothetical protein H0H81_011949 [Sphagnurus paluster]|uniref:MYND-type domain-containing protein n=1 Tax=Sphagnurus paluster TaxID=117069 RepID=A0A9P7KHE2_9AGAR|nr:hypothetical protein H0H81_011949 [Sphagnurus paluster]
MLLELLDLIKLSTLPEGQDPPYENFLAADIGVPALWAIGRWASFNVEEIAPRLKESWQYIWAWISCIHRQECAAEVMSVGRGACCSAIALLARGEGMTELMAETPGFFTALAEFWAEECDYVPSSTFPQNPNTMPASRAMYRFTDSSKPKWFDEVHLALGKEPGETARVTLQTLRRRIQENILNFPALVSDLHILNEGCDIVKAVMDRLLACTGDQVESASLCLTFCVKYSIITLQLESGRAWAYRMYDAPILRAIIQGSIWLVTDELYLAAALREITPYLIFRSVLYRAEKALDNIENLGLEEQMEKEFPVYKAFQIYKKVLGQRLQLAEGRSIGKKICENSKCARVANSKEFLRCSGCKKVYYCNKICQKRSWREGDHRNLCKMLAEEPGGIGLKNGPGEGKLLPVDYKFFRKLVNSDMAAHHAAFKQLRIRMILSTPPGERVPVVASVLDYTGPEVKTRLEMDPVGTSFAEWGDGDGYRTLLNMVKRVEQGGPNAGTIVRAILPFGCRPFPCELLLLGM